MTSMVHSPPEVWEGLGQLRRDLESVSLGRFTAEDMYELILRGVFQLWTLWDNSPKITGVMLTEIVSYPRRKVLNVPFAAGVGLEQWRVAAKGLESFARQNGCQEIEGWGKKGWGKVLDWEVPYYGLRKVL